MNAFVDFIVRLLTDAAEMPQAFLDVLAVSDPITAVIWAVGTVLTLASVGVMGYLTAGALGVPLPHLGRGPENRVE